MELTDKQRKQANAIASLLIQPDRSSITQGVELAAALGDQAIFAELLAGMKPRADTKQRPVSQRRFPMPERATLFDKPTGMRAWHDLAMVHLLAASELPIRDKVTSIALGTPIRKYSEPSPSLFLDGLERLTALTHLDLHLTTRDEALDLSALERFENLTHLKIRGRAFPGPLPSIAKLESLEGGELSLAPEASFPELRSIRGEIVVDAAITPEMMPNLTNIEARGGIALDGFESLGKLSCNGGEVRVLGCRSIEHLSASVVRFVAPDLRHVGLLDRASPGLDVSQLESLDGLKLNRKSKFTGGVFPKGTVLLDPFVVLWGTAVTDLGNIGELAGLEVLLMSQVKAPVSLETLRHATDLRVLDIRYSPGVTDLSPLRDLPNLEVLVINDPERFDVPAELEDRVTKFWRRYQRASPVEATVREKS